MASALLNLKRTISKRETSVALIRLLCEIFGKKRKEWRVVLMDAFPNEST